MISHLLDPLLNLHGWEAYALVGALVFSEAAILIGFVFPGETAVIVGGVAASRPVGTGDNSPAIYRWVGRVRWQFSSRRDG